MTTYRLTVRRKTKDIAFIHVLTIQAVYETLIDLRYQYPKCFFVLQSIHT